MPKKFLNGHIEPSDDDRAAINRANAKHSNGAGTPEGKARSSRNASRHRLTPRGIQLPAEDPAAQQRHTQGFFDEYRPKGAIETSLVQMLADTAWRLNRYVKLENQLFAPQPSGGGADEDTRTLETQIRALNRLSIESERLRRCHESILHQLRDTQKRRRAEEQQLEKGRRVPVKG